MFKNVTIPVHAMPASIQTKFHNGELPAEITFEDGILICREAFVMTQGWFWGAMAHNAMEIALSPLDYERNRDNTFLKAQSDDLKKVELEDDWGGELWLRNVEWYTRPTVTTTRINHLALHVWDFIIQASAKQVRKDNAEAEATA